MRVLYITAGAANMYCGSCLRDNSVATELIKAGHDVMLLPLYTPTRTDEVNVSQRHLVFFSGISVYLEVKYRYFRQRHRWLDWLLDRPWLIRLATRNSSATDPRTLGQFAVSVLEGERGPLRKEVERLVNWLEQGPEPDVISLPFTLLISLAEPLKRSLGRPVCCTLQGEELFLGDLIEPYRSQALALIRSQVAHVDLFLAVSSFEADFMSGFLGVPREKIQVVGLGINPEGFAPRQPAPSGPFRIGYMARVAPEKGLQLLADAYHELRRRNLPPSRLDVAGHLRREHAGYLAAIERNMRDCGLGDEFTYHGELNREQKIRFLQSLDVMSVPCTYDEPKGLFLLEAMASGVPVVQPRRGSFPEIIGNTGAGILVAPDDPISLADGIERIWKDAKLARGLSEAGPRAVQEHYTSAGMATRTASAFSNAMQRTALPAGAGRQRP